MKACSWSSQCLWWYSGVVSQFPLRMPVTEVGKWPLDGGSMLGLVGDGIPELPCSPCGYGFVSLRPLYCPINEPSSLNWMSTLSPYSTRLSSLSRFRSGHSERWLKERFSSLSLLHNQIHTNQINEQIRWCMCCSFRRTNIRPAVCHSLLIRIVCSSPFTVLFIIIQEMTGFW